MKALSIKQPWLYFIKGGAKTIETRTWQTNYRGDIVLCSSLAPDRREIDLLMFVSIKSPEKLTYGCMECVAELYDVQPMTERHEEDAMVLLYPGAYSWFLRNIRLIEPKKVRGQLGLFEIPDRDFTFLDQQHQALHAKRTLSY